MARLVDGSPNAVTGGQGSRGGCPAACGSRLFRITWGACERRDFTGAADLRVGEEPAPEAAARESLVRVTAVGICGSDLHWYSEGGIGDAKITRPLVPGHEGAGEIADGPRRGERVAIDPAVPCERCRACRDGYRNLCYHLVFSGHGATDGMMRELMPWPSHLLHPLPDSVSDAGGALLEPLGVALWALDLGHVPFGGSVAVAGGGPIGLLLIQLLRAAGRVADRHGGAAGAPARGGAHAGVRTRRSRRGMTSRVTGRTSHSNWPGTTTRCGSRWSPCGRAGGLSSAGSRTRTRPRSGRRSRAARA